MSSDDSRFPATLGALGFNAGLQASVAKTIESMQPLKAIDGKAMAAVAETLRSFQPVAPQISEALSSVPLGPPPEVMDQIARLPVFNFAKTLEGVDLSPLMEPARILPRIEISEALKATIFNLRDLPPVVTPDLAAQFDVAARQAVVLADVDEVGDQVDIALAIDRMTAVERRSLALDVAILVGAFLVLAAWIQKEDPKSQAEGAGLFLTVAAAYIRVYWKLIGKIGEG